MINEEDIKEEKTASESADTAENVTSETEEVKEAADNTAPDAEAAEEKKDKKKNKADRKQEELKEKIAELEDIRVRQMAEFENFRRRTEKEKAQMFDMGAKSVIEKMLPVVDNFERGLASIPEADKESAFAEGMQKIYKQLMTELDNLGVKPIEAKGTPFNPEFHNAVMQVENSELESGTVAEDLLKGYTYHDTVVRHSMVSVVQ